MTINQNNILSVLEKSLREINYELITIQNAYLQDAIVTDLILEKLLKIY